MAHLQGLIIDGGWWWGGGCGGGSILHGVDLLSYFSLIGKSSSCGGNGFPLSLSEWSFTICPTPYNRKKIKCVECVVK